MASKRIILLTQFDPTVSREEKERGKKHRGQEGENFRERERERVYLLSIFFDDWSVKSLRGKRQS